MKWLMNAFIKLLNIVIVILGFRAAAFADRRSTSNVWVSLNCSLSFVSFIFITEFKGITRLEPSVSQGSLPTLLCHSIDFSLFTITDSCHIICRATHIFHNAAKVEEKYGLKFLSIFWLLSQAPRVYNFILGI